MDRIIRALHITYASLSFTLLLSLVLIGVLFLDEFFGHLLALITLSILLVMETKSPFIRLLWLIVLPLVTIAYGFSGTGHGHGEPAMLIWLTAIGIRVAGTQ